MKAVLRQAPNILSAMRLVAAPIAAGLIIEDSDVAALCVFAFAGLSDALDGFLAKRFGLSSRVGAWLDPAADKLLMLASYLSLTYVGAVPLWLTVLVIGRDAATVIGIGLARLIEAPLVVAPLVIGKINTVVQVIYVALVLLQRAAEFRADDALFAAAIVVAVFTVWSALANGQVWLTAVAHRRRAV